MDLEEAITVAKVTLQDEPCHLLIGWQSDSFEVYLFQKDNLWKGRFSSSRLEGFSRNLHMTESVYYANAKKCLSQARDDYSYELKCGFFYWKRKIKGSLIIEGFLPMELDLYPKHKYPDLVEVLLTMNKHMKQKVNKLKLEFDSIKSEYQKCLNDTQEFLNLKVQMERALCDKFLSLVTDKKSNLDAERRVPEGVLAKSRL